MLDRVRTSLPIVILIASFNLLSTDVFAQPGWLQQAEKTFHKRVTKPATREINNGRRSLPSPGSYVDPTSFAAFDVYIKNDHPSSLQVTVEYKTLSGKWRRESRLIPPRRTRWIGKTRNKIIYVSGKRYRTPNGRWVKTGDDREHSVYVSRNKPAAVYREKRFNMGDVFHHFTLRMN